MEKNITFELGNPQMNSFSDFFCCKCAVNSHMPEFTHLCHEVDGT